MEKQSRQDPRVIRTKRLLRDALIALMEEREFDHITVQDISDRATVKRATFYLHYKDKYDLLENCIDAVLEEFQREVSIRQEDEAFDYALGKPHPNFIQMFHQIAIHFHFYRALLVTNRIPYFAQGLMAVIHEFVSSGINRTEPDDSNLTARREIIIKYVESAFLEVIIWWIEQNMPYSEEEMASQLMDLSIQGPYIRNPVMKLKKEQEAADL
ncbi:TetR/AcrR family transcriptional regulator [Paenibacillus guangzhouensis]|uniref:TetR/AcrR family transcriptional regulator n=1 Tax=Paenibacillus guangzhouensis TaxID=1473112 RepID=UPI001D12F8D1|nr:TetR/AcrR family transcriptional regulator [Paenibacillus guangzhouensis]